MCLSLLVCIASYFLHFYFFLNILSCTLHVIVHEHYSDFVLYNLHTAQDGCPTESCFLQHYDCRDHGGHRDYQYIGCKVRLGYTHGMCVLVCVFEYASACVCTQ